jgi:hypothetical protein
MNIDLEVTPAEWPIYYRQFLSIIGERKFKPRMKALKQAMKKKGMRQYVGERLPLDLAMLHVWEEYISGRPLTWPPRTAHHYRLLSFVVMIVKLHRKLDGAAKKRLVGELNKSLDQEEGLGPFAFEMRAATGFMSLGCDVDFVDIQGRHQFDYIVTKDEFITEVECKYISADIGRKITQKKFHQLVDHFDSTFLRLLQSVDGGIYVGIKIPGRLEASDPELDVLLKQVQEAILKQEKSISTEGAEVFVKPFEVPDGMLSRLRTY